MLRFNDIADRLIEYNPQVDLERLQRAYVFTAKVHDGQERLSGEPYLIHPLEVAGILLDLHVDEDTIIAGLLHDTLEDTLTTREEIERLFGPSVAFLVEGLTKIARIEFKSAREQQAENFRKMLIAMSEDIRILMIKLADRLHNMRTIVHMKEESRRRIAQETMDIYVPLAHRLGVYWMKQELEDLSFRTLEPEVAKELEARLLISRDEREVYIEDVIGIISARLADIGLRCEVQGRVKDISSIHAKMKSQDLELEQIYDTIGFRIVIDGGIGDCYAALGQIHSVWPPVPGRFKDYIALPKPNGYRSLHTTVIGEYGERMEVQIRTVEMHRDAELGIAAHWKYKEGRLEADGDDSKFDWLRQLVEWQKEISDPHEFLDAVKLDLFPNEVFVFTPTGEVINLASGSTPIDFAYAIHSEVGSHCVGAKVNGRLVPLRQRLKDGDTVEIITSSSQSPRKDWLEFAVSSKARNHIRHAIRQAGKERAVALGRDILGRELRRNDLTLAGVLEDGRLQRYADAEFGGRTIDELFAAISYGKIAASVLVRKLAGGEGKAPPDLSAVASAANVVPKRLRRLFKRERRRSTSGVRVSGTPDVLVRFAGCCEPLPGDEIIGFVTRGRGVTIHTKGCARVFTLDPERKIAVEWDDEAKVARAIAIRVLSRDEPGMLAKITNTISAAGINIGSAKVSVDETTGRTAEQTFELWVPDARTLAGVMREIRKVKGVRSVERIRG
ncbi:MAG TPA: bifunctional (p)ppGpp synthetase/guanosine-3',5'-bis(diphosphate) 3'-pyrophosphohydrolase [Deltaproteobacteria bacterium]|nr:bifunctional (p)ppGpp synthetase/guanosine-3',5'-bis(diphosphate) 3'-pyrophosphohydrolase [Deltaproteobacteria bacterium]